MTSPIEELKFIKKTDLVIDHESELEKASDKILLQILKDLKGKRGAILIHDHLKDALVVISKKGNLNKKLIQDCFRKKKTVLSANTSIAIPISISEEILGVLYVGGVDNIMEKYAPLAGVESVLDGRFKYEHDALGLKKVFSRYVGEKVLKEILAHEQEDYLSGKRRNCSILFVDVNGFTAYSNSHTPESTIAFLNDFFGSISPVILKNYGTIDKFIGDEIMAIFGAPIAQKNHAFLAIKTAFQIIKKSRPIIKRHKIGDGGVLIGIASGWVVAGNIGFEQMTDYTVIGRKVNLASRLTLLAGRNEIYVDKVTKNSCDKYNYSSLGEKDAKGFGRVSVFKVQEYKR